MQIDARLYERHKDRVQCLVCNLKCSIDEGQKGICRTRINRGGALYSSAYGIIFKEGFDPIEQKPLFHFWPHSKTYSIGGLGCNLDCPWCQSWSAITDFLLSVTETDDKEHEHLTPEAVVAKAASLGAHSITYTYNEPSIWFEFVSDTARRAKEAGLCNVLITNSYYSAEALEEYRGLIDAVNIDVKGSTEEFYHQYLNAELGLTLQMARETQRAGIHVELTLLIIPTLNDSITDIRKLCTWIVAEMGPDTPLHISRFFPKASYRHLPLTPPEQLVGARQAAQEAGLQYVYIQNLPGACQDTFCPKCAATVIVRREGALAEWHLDKENRCTRCGTRVPLVGEFSPAASRVSTLLGV